MKNKNGITLIALVITIIVLLILAGVSIVTLTGDNGILTRAENAKNKTTEAEAIERIQLETIGSFEDNGKYNIEQALKKLDENLGLKVSNDDITKNADGTLTVKYKGYEIKVHLDGKVGNAKTVEGISAGNYGDYINYDVDLEIDGDQDGDRTDIDDWRIFYKDKLGNIFIIASDYVPVSKLEGTGMTTTGTYQAYWNSVPNYTEIDTKVARLFKFGFNYSNSAINAMSNHLLNKNLWSNFGNGINGATAIGGPTLEMYVDSWNAKGYTKLYCNNTTNEGYCVGTENKPKYWSVDMSSDSKGYEDTLYYPHKSDYNSCFGYWLAAPSANGSDYLVYVRSDGHVCFGGYFYDICGMRPVVCLPSGVNVTQGTDGIWNIN